MKKIETFSGSEAIKEIKQCAKKGASEGLYDPSPRRLRIPLELVTDLLFGNVGMLSLRVLIIFLRQLRKPRKTRVLYLLRVT